MTILQTCCCWKSVRQGSVACGVYTGIYYAVNAVHYSYLLREDLNFIKNNTGFSLINHNIAGATSAVFSSLILAFSSCGIVTTVLLFYGIYKDIKYLLVPWVFNMVFFTLVDVIYIIYGLFVHALQWNPAVAILIIVDFFLNTLNLYTILCVVSQYQEYRAGRGKAIDVENMRTSNHQFVITRPSATSCLTSNYRKSPIYYEKAATTPIHSPTKLQAPPLGRPRKSVKFGDSHETRMEPVWESVGLMNTDFVCK